MNNESIIFGFRGPFGVPVQIDQSLLILVAMLFGFVGVMDGNMEFVAILIVALVISIYLHELGHALGALWQGVAVGRIVLHGGGGYCSHAVAGPKESLWLIAAGPAVNLVLWLAAEPVSDLVLAASNESDLGYSAAHYIRFFGELNLWLFLFNMIPIIPLDGGRLFYLGLWWKLPRQTAMKITGLVGTILSVLWIPAAILFFYVYGFILFFIPSIRDNWRRFKGEMLE